MCVSKKKKPIDATCNGDSGGSVMHLEGGNYESIGIVSWGVEGCQAGAPSVMHRVTSSLPWILDNLEAEGSGLCPREAEPSPHCVTVAGAVVGMPCIFPSIVAGVNITTCTRIDGDEKPWCSTKVDSSGVQEVGHWGYCPLTGC